MRLGCRRAVAGDPADQLAQHDPGTLVLLAVVAWLGPEPVPIILITDHPDLLPDPLAQLVGDPLALTRATTTLTRRGMAGLGGSHALQVHRVPAALLRARTRHDPTPWPQVVVRLLHTRCPARCGTTRRCGRTGSSYSRCYRR
jgi:hypothetical protein